MKRFDFDLNTLQRSKINQKFDFPPTINLNEFTLDQLSDLGNKLPEDTFELTGILIHNGTAEAGHYYSYIRIPGSDDGSGHWIEFNDAEVSEFDGSKIPDSSFGGPWDRLHPNPDMLKSYNAYMLFYRRKASVSQTRYRSAVDARQLSSIGDHSRHVTEEIMRKNAITMRWFYLLDSSYVHFIRSILFHWKHLKEHGCSEDHHVEARVVSLLMTYVTVVLSKDRDQTAVNGLLYDLKQAIDSCVDCLGLVPWWVSANYSTSVDLLLRHPMTRIRATFKNFLIIILRELRDTGPEKYGIDTFNQDVYKCMRHTNPNGALPRVLRIFHREIYSVAKWQRTWDEYFMLWQEVASLGAHESYFILADDFLQDCLKLIFMNEGGMEKLNYGARHQDNLKIFRKLKSLMTCHEIGRIVTVLFKHLSIFHEPVEPSIARFASGRAGEVLLPLSQGEWYFIWLHGDPIAFINKCFDAWDTDSKCLFPRDVVAHILETTSDIKMVRTVITGIADSIREYHSQAAGALLQTAVYICKKLPDHLEGETFVDAAVSSLRCHLEVEDLPKTNAFSEYTDYDNNGGVLFVKFFETLAHMEIRDDSSGRVWRPYLDIVLDKIDNYIPVLVAYGHYEARDAAVESADRLLFHHMPPSSATDGQVTELDKIRTSAVKHIFWACDRFIHALSHSNLPFLFIEPTWHVMTRCYEVLERILGDKDLCQALGDTVQDRDMSLIERYLNLKEEKLEYQKTGGGEDGGLPGSSASGELILLDVEMPTSDPELDDTPLTNPELDGIPIVSLLSSESSAFSDDSSDLETVIELKSNGSNL